MSPKSYWQDREPVPGDYNGVDGIHLVDLPFQPEDGLSPRDLMVIARIQALQSAGIPIQQCGIEPQVEGNIVLQTVVVGGALEDVCVEKHARELLEAGVPQVIIDLALTSKG